MAGKTVRLIISGRVQGVGYRDWAVQQARELGLSGWVRNRSDGSVEALAWGEPDRVERFIEACRRGPRLAFVSKLAQADAEAESGVTGFSQRPTL